MVWLSATRVGMAQRDDEARVTNALYARLEQLIIRAFLWCSARCWSWSRKRQTEEAPGDWIICTGKGKRGQTNRRAVERDRPHRFGHIPIAIISLRIADGAQVSRGHL